MFIEKRDRHSFYDFVDDVFSESRFNIGVVKSREKLLRFTGPLRFFRIFLVLFDSFYIPWTAYALRAKDFIFVREFVSPAFCFSALIIYPIREKILLNVNHNFQRYEHRLIHRWAIDFLDSLGYTFFMFESQETYLALTNPVLSMPFVSRHTSLPEIGKTKPVIGVVGALRKEKQMEEIN
mgnify:CR=1 FL=1